MSLSPSKTYMPVLRWKQAEKGALRDLSPEVASKVLPLVEVVPGSLRERRQCGPTQSASFYLSRIGEEIAGLAGLDRVMVDTQELGADYKLRTGKHPLQVIVENTISNQNRPIPVIPVPLIRGVGTAALAIREEWNTEIALRIDLTRFRLEEIETIEALVDQAKVPMNEVHLVLDFKQVEAGDTRYSRAIRFLNDRLLNFCLSVTLLGGSFPVDLQGRTPGEYTIRRYEWLAWQRAVGRPLGAGFSPPLFGDYTIQHCVHREPPKHPNYTASIRYAADDEWVIMRGEGVLNKTGAGFAQWPANAQLLEDRPEYGGPEFSAGDRYIHEMATHPPNNGTATTWLQAGINHHMTLASRQAASAFDSLLRSKIRVETRMTMAEARETAADRT